jgi:hypothetical protein
MITLGSYHDAMAKKETLHEFKDAAILQSNYHLPVFKCYEKIGYV